MPGPISQYVLPPLPELENTKLWFTIDYGGSLIKLMYHQKSSDKHKQTGLAVAIFAHGNLDGLVEFINTHVHGPEEQQSTPYLIHSTGVGIKRDGKTLEDRLSIKFKNLVEGDCFAKGMQVLLKSASEEELFFELPRTGFNQALVIAQGFIKMKLTIQEKGILDAEAGIFKETTGNALLDMSSDQLYKDYYTDSQIAPSLVVMCSSGFAMAKLGEDHKLTGGEDYSPRGGRTLMGLGSLLTGAKDYEELMELASRGNVENLDIMIRDLKGGDPEDFYGLFPDSCHCFNFGKAYGKSIADYSREDLAAAVVFLSCSDLAQFALNGARVHQLKSIMLCGTMINHEIVRQFVANCFLAMALMQPPEMQPKLRFCKLGPYLGSIGAWVYGIDAEVAKSVDK